MKRERQTERHLYRGDDYLGENELPFNANTESEITFYPASYSSNKRKILLQLLKFTLKQHYTSTMSRLEWMTAVTDSNGIEMRASESEIGSWQRLWSKCRKNNHHEYKKFQPTAERCSTF